MKCFMLKELLEDIFGAELIKQFQQKRPGGFVDLMIAFESRKRGIYHFINIIALLY